MNDDAVDTRAAAGSGDWLVDPTHPLLDAEAASRLEDGSGPDRLAWNAFRSLAQWNTDVWVPALLEVALGPGNRLSGLEWGEASVEPWGSGLSFAGGADVVIDGPEAVVLVEASLRADLSADHLAHGADQVLGMSRRGGRPTAYVLVTPGLQEGEAERVDDLVAADLVELPEGEGHGLRTEALEAMAGWLTWADLGALALDLAEEADSLRSDLVHRLISDLQERFPGLEV